MYLSVIFGLKCNLVWQVLFLFCPKMANVEGLVSSEQKSNTKRKANAWCSAVNCSNSDSSNPNISFFRFPSNPERYVLFPCICNYSKTLHQAQTFTSCWTNNCLKKSQFVIIYCGSKEWVVSCRREDLLNKTTKYLYNNCRLCANHFEDVMFLNFQKNRLKPDAKPTIFDIPNPPAQIGSKRGKLQRTYALPTRQGIIYFFFLPFL